MSFTPPFGCWEDACLWFQQETSTEGGCARYLDQRVRRKLSRKGKHKRVIMEVIVVFVAGRNCTCSHALTATASATAASGHLCVVELAINRRWRTRSSRSRGRIIVRVARGSSKAGGGEQEPGRSRARTLNFALLQPLLRRLPLSQPPSSASSAAPARTVSRFSASLVRFPVLGHQDIAG